MLDLNHGSAACYGEAETPAGARINALIDAALSGRRGRETPRDYLGASRVGEPCARRLVYEVRGVAPDEGRGTDGQAIRVFDAGHAFETLAARWLRDAGFDLETRHRGGGRIGFTAAGGKICGHVDGIVRGGPDIGIRWPALWECKALNARSFAEFSKRGLRRFSEVYWGQVQVYMAYMQLETAIVTAVNKDSQDLRHEIVPCDPACAQALSDRAVDVLRAAAAGELMPRVSERPDCHFCRWCPYARRCHGECADAN